MLWRVSGWVSIRAVVASLPKQEAVLQELRMPKQRGYGPLTQNVPQAFQGFTLLVNVAVPGTWALTTLHLASD